MTTTRPKKIIVSTQEAADAEKAKDPSADVRVDPALVSAGAELLRKLDHPAPWHWDLAEHRGPHLVDANGDYVLYDEGDGIIVSSGRDAALEARVRALIASAPDMLALIRKLSTWRPRGLEGQIEDDVAGIRQEACALLERLAKEGA